MGFIQAPRLVKRDLFLEIRSNRGHIHSAS